VVGLLPDEPDAMTPEFDAPEGGYFEHWMEALEELDRALPEPAYPACPNCGRRELRAQYVGDPTDRIGYGAIWCDHCHWGAYTGRAEIPPAAGLLPFGTADDVVRARIPSFRETPHRLDDDVIEEFEGGPEEGGER
jgi:hypothetical protein